MAGQAQWEVNLNISNNLQELYSLAEKLQGEIDNLTNQKHEIKLNIDEKELNSALKNLNKMLDSIGKGTGDFKQFETLSKDINEAVSSVKNLGKAFGTIDKDTGMSDMLSTIKNIDTSLTNLASNFGKVKSGISDVGSEIKDLGNAAKVVDQLESATDSAKRKTPRKKKQKSISDDEYSKNEELYAAILDDHISKGDTVLGGRATTTHLENGLVRVTAKIKDAEGNWKSFKTTLDADLNETNTSFSPITSGISKLEKQLKESEAEKTNLSLGEIQSQVERIRNALNLDDTFQINVDNKGIVSITQTLSEAGNVATSTAQTFRNVDDAIANFGEKASSVAEKTKVSLKQAKEVQKESAKAENNSSKTSSDKRQPSITKAWDEAIKINNALKSTKSITDNLKIVMPEADFSKIDVQIKKLNSDLTSGVKTVSEYKKEISGLVSSSGSIVTADGVSKFKNQLQKVIDSSATKLSNFEKNPAPSNQNSIWKGYLAEYTAALEKLRSEFEKIGSTDIMSSEQLKNISDAENKLKELESTMKNMKMSDKGSNPVSRDSLRLQIAQILEKYTGMSKALRAEFKALDDQLSRLGADANVSHLTSQFESLQRMAIQTGQATTSLWSAIKDKAFYGLAGQIGSYFGFNDVVEGIKKVASTVTDLNTQFTELSKVSDATTSQLYSNFSDFADIAKDVGGTISDTISATSDWSRNGYDLEQSKELARVAQLYKNVGDGIDIDEANESLISTLQGFKLQADDAEHIIDVFNEVSNNEAIDSSGIGEALQRSAASFNAAHTSLEKSVALVSATNSVLQDPSKVGYRHIADLHSNVMIIKEAISVNI